MEKTPAVFDEARFPVLVTLFLFVLGLAASAALEVLKLGFSPATVLAACAVCLAVLAAVFSRYFRKWLRDHTRPRALIVLQLDEPRKPARGLVAMVSKGIGVTSAKDAVFAHRDRLEHLRLITSHEAITYAADVEIFAKQNCSRLRDVTICPLEDVESIPKAKKLVESLRAELLRQGLPEDEVVCDFTGLNKQASAGMVLACAPKRARLQYMVAPQQTEDLRADPTGGRSKPMEIETAYEVQDQV